MKFVLAPDSFKESMTSKEVCESMEKGIKKVYPNAECIKVPMADGGEGTVDALVEATGGELYSLAVTGPLGNTVQGTYGILGDKITAVIEMASASGIHLVKREERNPLKTTTYGTGELIRAALDKGVKNIVIGIGGSATNDGGAGMLQALGVKLLDNKEHEIGFGGGALSKLDKIDVSNMDTRIKDVNIEVACDVTNPLVGEKGASAIFGPQKGATKEMVKELDGNLIHYAKLINKFLHKDVANEEGAGAAGGLGAALLAFLDGKLIRGIELVVKYTKLSEKIEGADYLFTGEGSMDGQTIFGKTPIGVAKVAKDKGVPVIAFAGKIGDGIENLYSQGINSIICILSGLTSLEEALKYGKENTEKCVENIVRIIAINNK